MKLDEYRTHILRPISEDLPQGALLDQSNPDYDFIETQLMKIGSLSHEGIEWQKVEKAAVALLSAQSKDIKLLSYLLQVLQYQPTPERYILSLNILADFIRAFWDIAHPFKGARGEIARKRLLTQMIERSIKSFDTIDLTQFDQTEKTELSHAFTVISSAFEEKSLEADELSRLFSVQERFSAVVVEDKKSSSRTAETGSNSEAVTELSLPKAKISFDSSDERALKKTLTQISHFLNELDQRALVLKVKRLALWYTIMAVPMHKKDGETELASVPIDKTSEYREQLGKPTLELWEKIEQSISLSPFWLDGHYLSYQVAQALELREVAYSIHAELFAFLTRLPELKKLSFKGGIPFISEETLKWLEQSQASVQAVAQVGDQGMHSMNYADDRQALVTRMLEEKGFDHTIKYLNDGLGAAINLRDSVYWRVILAEVYHSQGLTLLAQDLYQSLVTTIYKADINDWEPQLIYRINQHLKSGIKE